MLLDRYASLYFIMLISKDDNELVTLEAIHMFVEVLDRYFGNVSTVLPVSAAYRIEHDTNTSASAYLIADSCRCASSTSFSTSTRCDRWRRSYSYTIVIEPSTDCCFRWCRRTTSWTSS